MVSYLDYILLGFGMSRRIEKWYVIIGEELGETGKAILEGDLVAVEKEAIQTATAALKLAWTCRRKRVALEAREKRAPQRR